jgi:hypothetical protein
MLQQPIPAMHSCVRRKHKKDKVKDKKEDQVKDRDERDSDSGTSSG